MAEEWLKGETEVDGRTIRCPATSQAILLTSFVAKKWDEDDVPPETSPLSSRDEKFWCELLAEGATEQTIAIDNLEKLRFTRWLAAREEAMDEDEP
eukprot:2828704-Prymnesium_polylepis.1